MNNMVNLLMNFLRIDSFFTPLLYHGVDSSFRECGHDRGPTPAGGRKILWAGENVKGCGTFIGGVRQGSDTTYRKVGGGEVHETQGK
jgi:hypothetical protein